VRIEVKMPNLGYDMDAGKIVSWLKKIGDSVARGEPIAEVETDKATVEMESMRSGVLVEIVAAEGADVRVGEVIAYLETRD
jgi:pyruvate/2-oxoglutarate dehydrogenase complex dihydrolipoamide acyltransferase (E2) component